MNKPAHKGLIRWFTYNPVAANLLMLTIIIAGAVSFFTIKRSLNPDIEPNTISVSVIYPGASPEEVERSVTVKIEERIKDIEGVSRYYSVSDESLSNISIEVADGYDVLEVMDKVQSKVDSIKSFPKEVEKPVIARETIRHRAVMIQLYGDMDELGMKTLAEKLKQEMQQDPIYGSIDILGARNYEISIEIPEEALRKYQLTISQVVQAINGSSVDIPGGRIKTDEGQILIRSSGQAYNQYDFENIVLKSFPDSSQITLGDIANIKDGFAEVDGFARFNGKPSIALAVYGGEDQDILTVAKAARNFVKQKNEELPRNVSLVVWADATYYLQSRLQMMSTNLLEGAVLVFITLVLFLDLKSAFWVIASLPVCFLGTFILMPLDPFDVSLNMISLFGFFLVLGIVVDDGIVIAESIHTQTYEYGDTLDNVVTGASAVAMPATYGVLTTIAAFAPTIFISGPYAAIPQAIGYVVIFCLTFSIIESKWLLPAHMGMTRGAGRPSKLMGTVQGVLKVAQTRCDDSLTYFIEAYYRPLLSKALEHRYVTLAIFIAGLILSLGLITSGIARLAMFPDIPGDFLIAKVEMRQGSNDKQMRNALGVVEGAILKIEKDYKAKHNSEDDLIQQRLVTTNDGRVGLVMLELVKNEQRNIDSDTLVNLWRKQVGEIAGTKSVTFSSVENAGSPPLAFKVVGSDPEQLAGAANDLEKKLNDYNGVFDINNGSSDINDELHISIKPSALSLGLTLADIGTQVRQAFYGAEAQRIQRGNNEIKVMVRYPKKERHSLSSLENMYITTPAGEIVPFSSVASVDMRRGLAKRTRINGEQAVTVAARVDQEQIQPSKISDDILKNYAPKLQQKYPGVKIKLDGKSMEAQTMLAKLFVSLALALLAIYVLLAIPLGSYTQPFMIMSVIPFGMIGAIIGHVVMNVSINMLSFYGIIALAGVVVNDSLVLVSFINDAQGSGLRKHQAIIESGAQRFRAVLITSLTTFLGLAPMLFETSVQAQLVIPMAISLSYGIVFSTVITLILIPCLYQVLDDIERVWKSRSQSDSKEAFVPIINE